MPESKSSSSGLTTTEWQMLRDLLNRAAAKIRHEVEDFMKVTRDFVGDERTPEQKAADRERLMGAVERLKVKMEQKAESKEQALDGLEGGRMCGGIDKSVGVKL